MLPFKGAQRKTASIKGSKVTLVLGFHIKQHICHWIHDDIAKYPETVNIFYLGNKSFVIPKLL